MDRKKIVAYLQVHLNEFAETNGFTWKPGLDAFQKEIKEGTLSITPSVVAFRDAFLLDLNLGIRLPAVENLAVKFTARLFGFPVELQTVRISYGILSNQSSQVVQAQEPMVGLENAANAFLTFLQKKGIQFLSKNSDLSTIDWIINEQPFAPTPYAFSDAHRCFKGAIIARLTNNPQFESIVEAYAEQLSMDLHSEILLPNFHRMLGYLRPISMN